MLQYGIPFEELDELDTVTEAEIAKDMWEQEIIAKRPAIDLYQAVTSYIGVKHTNDSLQKLLNSYLYINSEDTKKEAGKDLKIYSPQAIKDIKEAYEQGLIGNSYAAMLGYKALVASGIGWED